MCDDRNHNWHVDVRVPCTESNADSEAIEKIMNEGGKQVQIACSLFALQRLQASLRSDCLAFARIIGLLELIFLSFLLLLLILQAIRRLILMIMVIVLIFSPVMVGHSQNFKQSLQNQKEDDCADKDKRHYLSVSFWVLEGIREDMDNCITDDGSAAERVQHVY